MVPSAVLVADTSKLIVTDMDRLVSGCLFVAALCGNHDLNICPVVRIRKKKITGV